jgi:hypothetical protein
MPTIEAHAVQHPVVGLPACYQGIYHPHWEIDHILVRVPRTRGLVLAGLALLALGVARWLNWVDTPLALIWGVGVLVLGAMPGEERWMPGFVPGIEPPPEGGTYRLEFEGIVTHRGWYGHMGWMQRAVLVTRMIRCEEAEPGSQCAPSDTSPTLSEWVLDNQDR